MPRDIFTCGKFINWTGMDGEVAVPPAFRGILRFRGHRGEWDAGRGANNKSIKLEFNMTSYKLLDINIDIAKLY
jgi:hypothetical protein